MIISPLSSKAVSGRFKCRCSSSKHNASHPTTATAAPLRIPLLKCPPLKPKSSPFPPEIEIRSNQHSKKRRNSCATTDVLLLMDSLQLSVPPDIYASLLKECTHSRDALRGAEVHAHIKRAAHHPPSLLLANCLLLMYMSCGCFDAAHKLFDEMTIKDSISWAIMIAAHADNGDHGHALHVFHQMRQSGLEFTNLIITCVLKACVHTRDFGLGKQIHGWVIKMESDSTNISQNLFLGSLLIDFYGKFRCVQSARRVFDQICHHRDTVIWTALIVVYGREEHFDEVLQVFKEMGRAGAKKNNFTFSSVIRACGRIRDHGWCGRQMHANAIKHGVETDSYVQSSLVDMYGKCGLLEDARKVFEMVCNKRYNDVCWNAMLTSYTRNRFHIEAIKLLYQMKTVGIQPQESVLNELRIACGS